ncbi:hypothetical protein ACP4OV_012365 [Aristida adscensionis]
MGAATGRVLCSALSACNGEVVQIPVRSLHAYASRIHRRPPPIRRRRPSPAPPAPPRRRPCPSPAPRATPCAAGRRLRLKPPPPAAGAWGRRFTFSSAPPPPLPPMATVSAPSGLLAPAEQSQSTLGLGRPSGLQLVTHGVSSRLDERVHCHSSLRQNTIVTAENENPPLMPAIVTPGGPLDLETVQLGNWEIV